MVEHAASVGIDQKKTVWFGVGKSLESFGPKAWEKRTQKVIEEKIIPKMSPAWKMRLETHKATIAKVSGWVATAAEVGVVAGVTYGGIRLIAKKVGERKGSLMQQVVLGERVNIAPKVHKSKEMIGVDAQFWDGRNAGSPTDDLRWLEALAPKNIGPLPATQFRVSPTISGESSSVSGTLQGLEKVRIESARSPEEMPDWLRDIIENQKTKERLARENAPEFIKKAIATRSASRASEQVAAKVDVTHPQQWWLDRKAAGLDRPPKRTRIGANIRKRISNMPLIKDLPVRQRLYFDKQRVGDITKRMRVNRSDVVAQTGLSSVVTAPAEVMAKATNTLSEKDAWNANLDTALTEVNEKIRTTPRLFLDEAYKAADVSYAHHQTERFMGEVLANVQVLHKKVLSKAKVSQLVAAVQNAPDHNTKVETAKKLMQYGFDKLPPDMKDRLRRQDMGKPNIDAYAREWVHTLKAVGVDVL